MQRKPLTPPFPRPPTLPECTEFEIQTGADKAVRDRGSFCAAVPPPIVELAPWQYQKVLPKRTNTRLAPVMFWVMPNSTPAPAVHPNRRIVQAYRVWPVTPPRSRSRCLLAFMMAPLQPFHRPTLGRNA